MYKLSLGCATIVLLFAVPSVAQISRFSASLDGAHSVPPNTSTARGWATVRFDGATNRVSIFAASSGMNSRAAHLHLGVPGVAGPVLVPLGSIGSNWVGQGTLTSAQVQDLLNGNVYVNVHSSAFPGGEIRGQLVPAQSFVGSASLTGAQSTPPVVTQATGFCDVYLHTPDNVLTYDLTTANLSGFASHIHRGVPGTPGPIVVGLNGGPTRWCGVTDRLSDADVQSLFNGSLYVNVHTTAHLGGEIRGQLIMGVRDFAAPMDGSQAVPANTSTALGSGIAELQPDGSLTYCVESTGLAGLVAHIHSAPAGNVGSVVTSLVGGPTLWQGTTGVLSAADRSALLAGNLYFNIHTSAFPGGEIRGQLRHAVLPSTFGSGCAGTNGFKPEIGSNSFAGLGGTLGVTLHGAAPTRSAVYLLGIDRDQFGPVPLPLDLSFLQLPGCYLLVNSLISISGIVTDAEGCAGISIPIKFIPATRGLVTIHQWLVLDPGANALGLIASNGLESRHQ